MSDSEPFVVRNIGYGELTRLRVVAQEAQRVTHGKPCRVYWGSHGCRFERGHDGPHECECAAAEHEAEGIENVGAPPYYGPDTWFYGEDAA